MKKIANIVLNDFTNDSRVLKISKSLNKNNYHAVVVAIYNKGLKQQDCVDGVEVERIKLTSRYWPKWKPLKIVKYFEFFCRAFWRFRKVDIVHCNDLSALPIGILIKLLRNNVKVVYDCHEYQTEINGLKGFNKKALKIIERFLIPFVDKVITVSLSISEEYVRLYNIPKPAVVLNCPLYSQQVESNLLRQNLSIRENQTIFLYQGGFTPGRGIELLLDAFSELESDTNVLVFMGYGALDNLIKEKAESTSNIFFHPAVPPNVLLNYTASADYGVLFYEDSCLNHRYCSPNKIFEYLMAGLPVISSNLFEMKRLIEQEKIGIVASSNTVKGFRESINDLLSRDYAAIQRNVLDARKGFSWEEQEKELMKAYNAL